MEGTEDAPNRWEEGSKVPDWVPGHPEGPLERHQAAPSYAGQSSVTREAPEAHTAHPEHTTSPLGLSKAATSDEKEQVAQQEMGKSYQELEGKERQRVSREAREGGASDAM